jgi:hypothetical protein
MIITLIAILGLALVISMYFNYQQNAQIKLGSGGANLPSLPNIKKYVTHKKKQNPGTASAWTITDELLALDGLYGKAIQRIPTTKPIDSALAKTYHQNHHTDGMCNGDTTCGVYLTLPEIFSGIITHFGNSTMGSTGYADAAFYAYLIRYSSGANANRTSVAIQIARDNGAHPPTGYPQLYNYGDLCPPKCPNTGTRVMHP